MVYILKEWYKKRFADPSTFVLLGLLFFLFCVIYFFGNILMPLLVAVVLSYLLEPLVKKIEKLGANRTIAVSFSLTFLFGLSLFLIIILLPVIWNQGVLLIVELPTIINKWNAFIVNLPEQYDGIIDEKSILKIFDEINSALLVFGQNILSFSLSSIVNLVAIMVYVILVPLLMFFFLKDKSVILSYIRNALPQKIELASKVWGEVNVQIGNYIKGKLIEILVVGLATYLLFLFVDLRYSVILSTLVGVSVLIPYVGATIVTIPVIAIALLQWGLTPDFWYCLLFYLLIQGLDGNLLVPILFSEAVNLHPSVIIISVLIFGGLWGFWGIFFAIPLASLVKAIIYSWPTLEREMD